MSIPTPNLFNVLSHGPLNDPLVDLVGEHKERRSGIDTEKGCESAAPGLAQELHQADLVRASGAVVRLVITFKRTAMDSEVAEEKSAEELAARDAERHEHLATGFFVSPLHIVGPAHAFDPPTAEHEFLSVHFLRGRDCTDAAAEERLPAAFDLEAQRDLDARFSDRDISFIGGAFPKTNDCVFLTVGKGYKHPTFLLPSASLELKSQFVSVIGFPEKNPDSERLNKTLHRDFIKAYNMGKASARIFDKDEVDDTKSELNEDAESDGVSEDEDGAGPAASAAGAGAAAVRAESKSAAAPRGQQPKSKAELALELANSRSARRAAPLARDAAAARAAAAAAAEAAEKAALAKDVLHAIATMDQRGRGAAGAGGRKAKRRAPKQGSLSGLHSRIFHGYDKLVLSAGSLVALRAALDGKSAAAAAAESVQAKQRAAAAAAEGRPPAQQVAAERAQAVLTRSFVFVTASCARGMAGAPVVLAEQPLTFAGIALGCTPNSRANDCMSVFHPAFVFGYRSVVVPALAAIGRAKAVAKLGGAGGAKAKAAPKAASRKGGKGAESKSGAAAASEVPALPAAGLGVDAADDEDALAALASVAQFLPPSVVEFVRVALSQDETPAEAVAAAASASAPESKKASSSKLLGAGVGHKRKRSTTIPSPSNDKVPLSVTLAEQRARRKAKKRKIKEEKKASRKGAGSAAAGAGTAAAGGTARAAMETDGDDDEDREDNDE